MNGDTPQEFKTIRDEMDALLHAMRENQITLAQHERLQQLVQDNDEARTIYVQYMTLCADLRWQTDAPTADLPKTNEPSAPSGTIAASESLSHSPHSGPASSGVPAMQTVQIKTPLILTILASAALIAAIASLAVSYMAITQLDQSITASTHDPSDRTAERPYTDEELRLGVTFDGPLIPKPKLPLTIGQDDADTEVLKKKISVSYKESPLDEVFDDLAAKLGLDTIPNWAGLETAGIDEDATITLTLNDKPASDVIEIALQLASATAFEPIDYTIERDILVFSTQSDLTKMTDVRIYDVRDFVAASRLFDRYGFPRYIDAPWFHYKERVRLAEVDPSMLPSFSSTPDFDLQSALDSSPTGGRHPTRAKMTSVELRVGSMASSFGQTSRWIEKPSHDRGNYLDGRGTSNGIFGAGGGGGGGLFDDSDDNGDVDWQTEWGMEQLLELARSTIGKAEDWEFFGGEVSSIRELHGNLIIRTTSENHREMAKLLADLRATLELPERWPIPVRANRVPPIQQPLEKKNPLEPEGLEKIEEEPNDDEPRFEEPPPSDREQYEFIVDNPFLAALDNPLSTFSIDVDTASYTNIRRILNGGQLPPAGAVRVEEMINYFNYDYASLWNEPLNATAKQKNQPFAVGVEINDCPWNINHRLMRIALKGKEIDRDRLKSNLVFLIDVSSSMDDSAKLGLVEESMKMLANELTANDRVAIVVYAGASGVVLESTPGNQKQTIIDSLDALKVGGATAGAEGIERAYQVAAENFIEDGVNRVILATDGDFNVGPSSDDQLVRLIKEKRDTDIFLSTLLFGTGNIQDAKMEKISNAGNGNYYYIDSAKEAQKVLVEQMFGTLVTIAKDVKLQIEFNPKAVASYRLIGYENRMLKKEDFNDDMIDAGEIGAGHAVTALYELVPAGERDDPASAPPAVDPLKYQTQSKLTDAAAGDEVLTVKLRYKQPDGKMSTKIDYPVTNAGHGLGKASNDFRFAAAVASFGMILRDSPHQGASSYELVRQLVQNTLGEDEGGYRKELLELVNLADKLDR